jgi:hypothetical protein
MTTIFAGPYEITKANVKKTYVIMDDNSISVRTFKDNSLKKTKNLP